MPWGSTRRPGSAAGWSTSCRPWTRRSRTSTPPTRSSPRSPPARRAGSTPASSPTARRMRASARRRRRRTTGPLPTPCAARAPTACRSTTSRSTGAGSVPAGAARRPAIRRRSAICARRATCSGSPTASATTPTAPCGAGTAASARPAPTYAGRCGTGSWCCRARRAIRRRPTGSGCSRRSNGTAAATLFARAVGLGPADRIAVRLNGAAVPDARLRRIHHREGRPENGGRALPPHTTCVIDLTPDLVVAGDNELAVTLLFSGMAALSAADGQAIVIDEVDVTIVPA